MPSCVTSRIVCSVAEWNRSPAADAPDAVIAPSASTANMARPRAFNMRFILLASLLCEVPSAPDKPPPCAPPACARWAIHNPEVSKQSSKTEQRFEVSPNSARKAPAKSSSERFARVPIWLPRGPVPKWTARLRSQSPAKRGAGMRCLSLWVKQVGQLVASRSTSRRARERFVQRRGEELEMNRRRMEPGSPPAPSHYLAQCQATSSMPIPTRCLPRFCLCLCPGPGCCHCRCRYLRRLIRKRLSL